LGRAIAEVAYAKGYPVALVGRSKPKLINLSHKLKTEYPSRATISIHSVDLRNETRVEREFIKIKKIHGSIRALINNAGEWMGTTSLEKLSARQIRDALDLNFFSALHATISVLKIQKPNVQRQFAIINIGATASLDAWLEVLPFCLAKGTMRGLSRALSRDLGPRGVHVAQLIIDGMLDNERTRRLNPGIPKNRFLKSSSVAQSVFNVALQDPSSWTQEWDLRPFNESW